MRDLAILFVHLIVTVVRLSRPGAHHAIVAESLLLKHQLAILNRSRDRAPNLRPMDRVIAGLCADFMRIGQPIFYLVVAFVVLAVPTGFMGTTLPLLIRYAVRTDAEVGPRVASIINSPPTR